MKSPTATVLPSTLLCSVLLTTLLSGCLLLKRSETVPGEPVSITGIVISQEDEERLPEIYVIVDGTDRHTLTDEDGRYAIDALDGNGKLVFSSPGFVTQEVKIKGRSEIDVALEAAKAEEEVAVGYGTQRRRNITGSVASVPIEDAKDRPVVRVEELLRGRTAGVQVYQTPSGGIAVRIRGSTSIHGSNEPLYVVDGIPVSADPDGGLGINPHTIASIEVLKDAGAAAIYGSRGANGVVVITTKRAGKGR